VLVVGDVVLTTGPGSATTSPDVAAQWPSTWLPCGAVGVNANDAMRQACYPGVEPPESVRNLDPRTPITGKAASRNTSASPAAPGMWGTRTNGTNP
jgi:hypothetical protein